MFTVQWNLFEPRFRAPVLARRPRDVLYAMCRGVAGRTLLGFNIDHGPSRLAITKAYEAAAHFTNYGKYYGPVPLNG